MLWKYINTNLNTKVKLEIERGIDKRLGTFKGVFISFYLYSLPQRTSKTKPITTSPDKIQQASIAETIATATKKLKRILKVCRV